MGLPGRAPGGGPHYRAAVSSEVCEPQREGNSYCIEEPTCLQTGAGLHAAFSQC